MSEVEIRDELKDQGVVGVNRVTLKKEGKVIPTNTLFLRLVSVYRSFQLYFIPKTLSTIPPFSAPFLQLIST